MEIKIEVKIGDVEIELSENEAKKLWAKLDVFFGERFVYVDGYYKPPYTITIENTCNDRDINVYSIN